MMPYLVNEEGEMIYEEPSESAEETVLSGEESAVSGEELDPVPESEAADPVGDLLADELPVSVVPYIGSPDVSVYTVGGAVNVDDTLIYRASVTGYGECTLVFPSDADAFLKVTSEGKLVNWDNANLVGRLYPSEITETTPQGVILITLLGRTSTSFASTWYRYGSDAYLTTYYPSGSTLASTQTYVDISSVKQTGWSFNFWMVCFLLLAFGILAFNGLRRLFTLH